MRGGPEVVERHQGLHARGSGHFTGTFEPIRCLSVGFPIDSFSFVTTERIHLLEL